MNRSITAKLILAFLTVSVIVVALASGITYWLTVREFKQRYSTKRATSSSRMLACTTR